MNFVLDTSWDDETYRSSKKFCRYSQFQKSWDLLTPASLVSFYCLLFLDCYRSFALSSLQISKVKWNHRKYWISCPFKEIDELLKGDKRPQCYSDFMNKIEVRYNIKIIEPNSVQYWKPDGWLINEGSQKPSNKIRLKIMAMFKVRVAVMHFTSWLNILWACD